MKDDKSTPRAILKHIKEKVLVNAQGQKAELTTDEELLYAILKVLVYNSKK